MRSHTSLVVAKIGAERIAPGTPHSQNQNTKEKTTKTRSGLEHQDNDLEIITDRAAIAAFDRKFKLMWDRPTNVNFNYLNDAKDLINPTARLNRVLRTTAMSTWHEVVAAA